MASWDDFPVVGEAKNTRDPWGDFPVVEETAEKEEPFFDISDTLSAAGQAVKGIPTTTPHAFRQLYSGLENPWTRSEGYKESQKSVDAYQQELEAANLEAEKSGDISTMSRGMRQAGQSLGFSAGAMGAGLVASTPSAAAGRSLGALAGPEGAVAGEIIGRGAGALASGYGAAYRMAGAQFLDDARKEIDAKFLKVTGELPNEQQQEEAYQELLPLAQAFGHAEAGPEAIGNLAMAGAGKYVFGLGRKTIEKLAASALGKTGAAAGALGTELAGETITGVEQNRIDSQKKDLLEGRDPSELAPRTADEYVESFKEVAPATLATMGLMGVAPAAVKAGSLLRGKPAEAAPADDFTQRAAMEGATSTEPVPVEVNGVTIATINPESGWTPEDVLDFANSPEDMAALARNKIITLPEVVAPIEGVDPAITDEMNARFAEGKAAGDANQTLAELERQKAAQTVDTEPDISTEWEYTALDNQGKELRGTMRAATQADAITGLRQQGFYPTHVNATAAAAPPTRDAVSASRNTDLFPDKTDFMGKLSQEAVLSNYQEQDGFGVAEYVNPDTGTTDVYLAAFGDNDFIAYIRVYDENGKPTNRFTSKLERRSKAPGVTKKMLSDLQSRLPAGHEYTEDVSVSTDGLKFIAGQLRQGYEVALDESGKPLTQDVAVSGESIVNDLPIAVDPNGKFENIRITNRAEFDKVRPVLGKMLESFGVGLGAQNVRWENGTAFIDIPVLRRKPAAPEVDISTDTETPEAWDRANRHQQSNEWFEGGRANLAVNEAFNRAATNGGADLATHGMAKVATLSGAIKALTDLLKNGLDQSRGRDADGARLHTAPLAVERDSAAVHAGTTSGGTSYRDGPFILVNSAAASRSDVGIRTMDTVQAVLVNEANAGQLDAIRKAIHAIRPDIIVELYSKADQVAATLTGKKPTAETLGVTPPPAPTLEASEGAARNAEMLRQAAARAAGTEQGPRIGFLQSPPAVTTETETPINAANVDGGSQGVQTESAEGSVPTVTEDTVSISDIPSTTETESDMGQNPTEGRPASMLGAKGFANKVSDWSKKQYSDFVRSDLYQDGRSDQELLSTFQYATTKPEWYQDLDKARHIPHIEHVLRAVDRGEPVSAEAIEDYGLVKYLEEYTSYKKAGKVYAPLAPETSPVTPQGEAPTTATEGQPMPGGSSEAERRFQAQKAARDAANKAASDRMMGQMRSGGVEVSADEVRRSGAASEAEWSPTVNEPASFTAANGQKVVGTVQSVAGGKAIVRFPWNGKEITQAVPVSQLSRPVASLTEPPSYQYTQEQNTRKAGKHFPTTPGVHANHDFRKSFASMAEDTSLSRIYRQIAKVMSKMDAFANIDLHIVADGDIGYAGEYSHSNGKSSIAVNLRQVARGKVDALGTILHEALHHITLAKVRNPQGAFETEVVAKLDTIRKRVKEYAKQQRLGKRLGYELNTLEEFISALTSPDFQNFLASIPDSFSTGVSVGKFRSALSEVFRLIAELIKGEPVARGSTMEQYFTTVLALFETPHRTLDIGKLEKLSAVQSLAGERAEMPQFMRDSLDTAKAMAAAGKTSEEIRAVTGWFSGKYDGKMRWEVPDDGARWIPAKQEQSRYNLSDLLEHDELYKAYPELKTLQVRIFPKLSRNEGALNFDQLTKGGFIAINGVDEYDRSSLLIHEAQHWIQWKESFARGSSATSPDVINAARQDYVSSGEMKKDYDQAWAKHNALSSQLSKEENRLLKQGTSPRKAYSELQPLRKEVEAAEDAMRFIGTSSVPYSFAFDRYQRTAGEIEARDVQARQNFTPEQRKAIAPYSSENIAKEDAIVMFGGKGPQESRGYRTPADMLAEAAQKAKGEAVGTKPQGLASMFKPQAKRPATGERKLLDMPVRNTLANAYREAVRGSSTQFAPLSSVYAQARLLQPGLTPEAFLAQVQEGYDNGTLLLEGAGSQQEAEQAGLSLPGTPVGTAVRMMPAPETPKSLADDGEPPTIDIGGEAEPADGKGKQLYQKNPTAIGDTYLTPADITLQEKKTQQETLDAARKIIGEEIAKTPGNTLAGRRAALDRFSLDTSIPPEVRAVGTGVIAQQADRMANLSEGDSQLLLDRMAEEAASLSDAMSSDLEGWRNLKADANLRIDKMAEEAGRTLNIFNVFRRLTPEGFLRRRMRQYNDAVREKMGQNFDVPVAKVESEIAMLRRMARESTSPERRKAILDAIKAYKQHDIDAKKLIEALFPQAGFRARMNKGGESLVRDFFQMMAGPRDGKGPLAEFDETIQGALSSMLRKVMEAKGLVAKNESMQMKDIDKLVRAISADELRFDKIAAADEAMQKELDSIEDPERRAVLQQAWEEATAKMYTNIASDATVRRALNAELKAANVDWRKMFDSSQKPDAIKAKTVDAVMAKIEALLTDPTDPTVRANLGMLRSEVGAAFDFITANKRTEWLAQREAVEARRRVAEHRAAFMEALRNQGVAEQAINRISEKLAGPQRGKPDQNPVSALVGEHMKVPVADFVDKLVALDVDRATAESLDKAASALRSEVAAAEKLKAAERAVAQLMKSLKPKPRAPREKIEKALKALFTADTVGALDDQAFFDAFGEAFNMPPLSDEQQTRIKKLIREVNALPKGPARLDKQQDLDEELALWKGIAARDVLLSAWYANILSGVSTQGMGLLGNALNFVPRSLFNMINNPRSAGAYFKGAFGEGLSTGLKEAAAAMKGRGLYKVSKYGDKNLVSALELLRKKGPSTLPEWVAYIASAGTRLRYVFRIMQAIDALAWNTAREGHAYLAAHRALLEQEKASDTKRTPEEFSRAFIDSLGGDTAQIEEDLRAARQALIDAGQPPSMLTVDRMAREARNLRREAGGVKAGNRFADRIVLQQDPEGSGKFISNLIDVFQKKDILGLPIGQLLIPFNRIVSNLFEQSLDYTPVGLVRAFLGGHLSDVKPGSFWNGKVEFKDKSQLFDQMERRERAMAAVTGMAAAAVIYALASAHEDEPDEDVPFMVYGWGPESKNKRAQMPKGWVPYSIKIGDNYVKFSEMPFGMMFAAAGSAMDAMRYKNMDKKTSTQRLAYVLKTAAKGFLNQGVMSSLDTAMETLMFDASEKKMADIPVNALKGLVPAQGMLRDISTIMDPNKVSSESLTSALLRDIPFAKSWGTKPDLNVFGEPIKLDGYPITRRIVTHREPHAVADYLGRNELNIPGMEQTIEIGKYLPDKAKDRIQARAVELGAMENGLFTPEQNYTFKKRAGELTKVAVQEIMEKNPKIATDKQRENIQSTINKRVEAARRRAMLEAVPVK